jgi:hypothetical protein
VVDWMLAHNPFRAPAAEELFVSGFRQMLAVASDLTPPVSPGPA